MPMRYKLLAYKSSRQILGQLVIGANLLIGGTFPGHAAINCEVSPASEFYAKWENDDQELEQFLKQNMSFRWDIVQYAMECIHPRRLEYYDFMAHGGPKAAEFLNQQLAATNDEIEITDILSVLDEMDRLETYDVSEDEKLMAVVLAAAARVESDFWKRLSQRRVDRIRSR